MMSPLTSLAANVGQPSLTGIHRERVSPPPFDKKEVKEWIKLCVTEKNAAELKFKGEWPVQQHASLKYWALMLKC